MLIWLLRRGINKISGITFNYVAEIKIAQERQRLKKWLKNPHIQNYTGLRLLIHTKPLLKLKPNLLLSSLNSAKHVASKQDSVSIER